MERTKATLEQEIDCSFSDLLGAVQSIEGTLQPREPKVSNEEILKWLNELAHDILCTHKIVNDYIFPRDTIEQLQNKRNKLNRQIATLKKANLVKCVKCDTPFDDDKCPQAEGNNLFCINCCEEKDI